MLPCKPGFCGVLQCRQEYGVDRPASDTSERRTNARALTQRHASVRLRGGAMPSFDATVIDIGPAGLRLRCDVELAPGDELAVEVFPREGFDPPIQVRGVVRHSVRVADATHAGLQLIVTLGPMADLPAAEGMRVQLDALRRSMAVLESGEAGRLTFHPEEMNEVATPAGVSRKRRLLLALFLLLLLCGLPVVWMAPARRPAQRGGPGFEDQYRRDTKAPVNPAAPRDAKAVDVDTGDAWSDRAWAALGAGAPGAIGALAREGLTLEPGGPDAYVNTLLLAQLQWAAGEGENAKATLEKAATQARLGQAPQSWLPVAERMERAIAEADILPLPVALPAIAVNAGAELKPLPTQGGTSLPLGEKLDATEQPVIPVLIEVDASDYTLTAWQGERRLASFPIGLGMRDTTPLGDFVVKNKIEHPDWYNRGETVPYGDPRNPLGDYWIGLGGAPEALGIGIHPAPTASGIGTNTSRGCVRMFPEDAARLFGICEVGTVVRIHE